MSSAASSRPFPGPPSTTASLRRASLYVRLGVLLGLVMPIVAAILFPTFTHEMHPAWLEFTRLAELPFVACELLLIHAALRRGYVDADTWRALPSDVRVALIVFVVGLTIGSTLMSKHAPVSIMVSVITLIHLRFAAAMFFLARRAPRAATGSFVPALASGLAALVVLIALRFALPPATSAVPGGEIEWSSAMPGFISVRHLGSWSGAIAAGLLLSLLYDGPGRARWTAPLYFLAAAVTAWSGTRAAVLAMAVVALTSVVALRRLPRPGALVRAAGLSLAALAVATLLAPNDPAFTLFASGDMQSAEAVTSGRMGLWQGTLAAWLRSPVFGLGSGSTFWEVQVGWTHTQPHNFVLQALISWGLVGAAGALWLLGRAIGAVHKTGFGDPALRPLCGTLYALLFMSLLEGMLHYPRFIMVIMIGFAVILAQREAAPGLRSERGGRCGPG